MSSKPVKVEITQLKASPHSAHSQRHSTGNDEERESMSKRRRTIKDEVENMNKTFTVINEAETHTDHKDESKQYTNTNQSASIGQIIIPVQAKNFN